MEIAPPLIKAAYSHFVAKRDRAMAELDVYLNKCVGVGEHAKVTDEVISLFKELDEAQSVIETIKEIVIENNRVAEENRRMVIERLDEAKKRQESTSNGDNT